MLGDDDGGHGRMTEEIFLYVLYCRSIYDIICRVIDMNRFDRMEESPNTISAMV